MKGYWIAHVTVTDPDQYKFYAEGASLVFKKYDARVLARGGKYKQLEGKGHPRNVVIEFPSFDQAIACYNSPEYHEAKAKRAAAAIAEIVIVEGAE